MANENSLENFGLQSNPVLKGSKPRLPLQELNNMLQQEEESTAVIQARKRRVSFANVNTIKEFNAGAESLLVCHTPAYEEPFSTCSDSSNRSTHETMTPAKSADCEDVGGNVVPNNLSLSNYNKRVSVGSSRVSLGPDQIGSQDMECTDVLESAYLSANTSGMEMTAAVQGVFSTSRLSLNSSKMTKTKYYNSMSYNGMELTDVNRPSVIEGTKIMNNTSFPDMEFTEVIHHHKIFESTRISNNITENGMEVTEATFPLIQERLPLIQVSMDTTVGSGMDLTEVLSPKLHNGSENVCNMTDTGLELTSSAVPELNERTRSVSNMTSSKMELTEAVTQQCQERNKTVNNFSQSGMELTGAGIPLFHERTRSVSNMTSSKMELTEAVTQQCQERNKTVNNFSQSGMELTGAGLSACNEKTRYVNNMTSIKMELTEAVTQQCQERNKTVNNFSQSGMELTGAGLSACNEKTRYVSNMTSSKMELTEAVTQQCQERNKTVNNFSQSGMELTGAGLSACNEKTRYVNNMTSIKMELTEAVTQQCQERNKTSNDISQIGMELTEPLYLKSCNEIKTDSRMTQSETELAVQNFSKSDLSQTANNMVQGRIEVTDILLPKFHEKTKLPSNVTYSSMEFTQPVLQRQCDQSKCVTNSTQSRMELTEPVLNRTPHGENSKLSGDILSEDTVDNPMQVADEIVTDVKQNSEVLNNIDSDDTVKGDEPRNNKMHEKVSTGLSEDTEKANTGEKENMLTKADFPTEVMDVTSDSIKDYTKIDTSVMILQDASESDDGHLEEKTINEGEIVTNCISSEVQKKEEAKNNLCNSRIQEKSINSVDVSIKKVTPFHNEIERESMKINFNALHIDCNDENEIQEREELPWTDEVKVVVSVANETVNHSKSTFIGEEQTLASCADQSEFISGSCSRIEMTGIAPLDEECDAKNIGERNVVIHTACNDRTLDIETDIRSVNKECNSLSGKENTDVNQTNIENEFDKLLNEIDLIENNMEDGVTGAKGNNTCNSDVVMDLDERDCTNCNGEESVDNKNKTISTSRVKSCQEVHDICMAKSFESDQLNTEISVRRRNSEEEINYADRGNGSNISCADNVIFHSNCQEVNNTQKGTLLNSTRSTMEPAEAMEVGSGDQAMNSSNHVECTVGPEQTEINSSSAHIKTETESHNTASATCDTSGLVKIQNRTEVTTQGRKRRYMKPSHENNPSKIYVQEQISSNIDNNIVNNMEITVNTEDGKESGNNKKIVTRCTVEIGSPQSNNHNASCLGSNKEGVPTSSGVEKDEGINCNMDTTQPCVNDISVHGNVEGPDNSNDVYQSVANHSNITFRRKSKSLKSVKNNRSQINNQATSIASFPNDMVPRSIGVVMNTEITITNFTVSDMNACSSFIHDQRKSNAEYSKAPLTPLSESVKEPDSVQAKKVQNSNIKHASSSGDQILSKTTTTDRENLIYECNHDQENTKSVQDIMNQQSSRTEINEDSPLQQIPRDFRDKWNLYEVSQGVWSLDLIPDTLLMIFKLDGHTKYDSEDGGFGIVNIKFKEIYASNEDPVKHYMAKTIMAKVSTRDLKKMCRKTSQIPCVVEHVSMFVQKTTTFGKYLKVLIDIYCAVLNNRTLTFEVCSARSRLWIKVYINLESFEYLTAADITVMNIKGNVEQSVIRKLFDTVKSGRNVLFEFVTKVDHYIRVERSIKSVR